MKTPTRGRSYGLRFNLTPLIDLSFLLIIFFLVASHFVRNESLEAVELPIASDPADDESAAVSRLVFTITREQKVWLNGEELRLEDAEALLVASSMESEGPIEVRIRADRGVPYRAVEPLLLACANAGIADVKFAVNPSGH